MLKRKYFTYTCTILRNVYLRITRINVTDIHFGGDHNTYSIQSHHFVAKYSFESTIPYFDQVQDLEPGNESLNSKDI